MQEADEDDDRDEKSNRRKGKTRRGSTRIQLIHDIDRYRFELAPPRMRVPWDWSVGYVAKPYEFRSNVARLRNNKYLNFTVRTIPSLERR